MSWLRALLLGIGLVCAWYVGTLFWYRNGLSVVVDIGNKKVNWLSAGCLTDWHGLEALRIVARDPLDEAAAEAASGRFRMMTPSYTNEPKSSQQMIPHWFACEGEVPLRPRPGWYLRIGHMGVGRTPCYWLADTAVRCSAPLYNKALYDNPAYPFKDKCKKYDTELLSCQRVAAPWAAYSNAKGN